MPKLSDSAEKDSEIVFTQNVDCPHCEAVNDVAFPTGKFDEDGLTDLEPGELAHDVTCLNCGESFEADFTGWMNYGDAG